MIYSSYLIIMMMFKQTNKRIREQTKIHDGYYCIILPSGCLIKILWLLKLFKQ